MYTIDFLYGMSHTFTKLGLVAVHVKNNRIQFYNNCEMSGGNFIQYQRNMPDNTKMQMAKTIEMEAIPILWRFIKC